VSHVYPPQPTPQSSYSSVNSGLLLSQVRIKERVEIGPRPATNSIRSLKQLSSEEKVITAPRRGHLSITFESASNQYVQMTPDAYLEVTVGQRSDSIPVIQNFQSVTQYIPSYFDKFYYGCQAQDDPFVMYFYGDPRGTAYNVSVEAGDQVIFRYHGEQVNPVDQLYQGGNVWDVVMRIRNSLANQCVNPGNAIKFEYLQVWVDFVDEILLGESKYYYLAGNDDDGWTLKDDWKPGIPEPSRKTDVTYDVQPVIAGDTLAVSWEEHTPLPDDTTKFLPDGIIRVIGKFFHPENLQRNKALLTATFITSDGEGYAHVNIEVIKNKQLKIVEHAPWTIWPYLPPQSNGDSRGADRPGYTPKRSLSIFVHDGSGQPLGNEQISIFTKYEEGSGGHGHGGNADDAGTTAALKAMPQSLQGLFYRKGLGNNPLLITTDENGIAVVDSFRASEASGKYLVTARLVSDTTIIDTVNLQVKVPGLVNFGTGDYWTLTGTTSKRGQNHLSNHWCTQKTKDSVKAALKDFYDWTLTQDRGGKAVKVGVNDMSLEWGGAFDIPGRWGFSDQHSFHRIGLSVDIDNTPGNFRAAGDTLTSTGNHLKKIFESYGGRKYRETSIHFGFDGGK
jgi:hypothetical protein